LDTCHDCREGKDLHSKAGYAAAGEEVTRTIVMNNRSPT
jgi:hypothetical protein